MEANTDRDRLLIGSLYVILTAVFPLIYMLIVYVFLWHEEFRKLRSYKIMAQMGIMEIIACYDTFIMGLVLATDFNFWGLASLGLQLGTSSWLTKQVFNVVLAINRITVICRIQEPRYVYWSSVSWTKDMNVIVLYSGLISNLVAFVLYLFIVVIIFMQKRKAHVNSQTKNAEIIILGQALMLYLSHLFFISTTYVLSSARHSYWSIAANNCFCALNQCLTPVLVFVLTNR
ncbi:hypothetical protein L596_013987 [Steinernema carpocapsae]|uniref:Serpentine receptor class gamma n=1 Tax=Steinernema carpocapsae TaxID=34508 RepID=A0A4U5NBH7_STECR|nr:hypothetical protein L596_013987 [Steinernema carpocapsae]